MTPRVDVFRNSLQTLPINQHFILCCALLISVSIGNSLSTNAQEIYSYKPDSLKEKGIVVKANRFSKQYSILMRDTTLDGNRFDYSWHKGQDSNGRFSPTTYILPAFLVDSALASSSDSLLIKDPKNKNIRLTGWPKKNLSTLAKKKIRLYIGYIDEKGNKSIVVQFISKKEFARMRKMYSSQLFLVVPSKVLHFAIITLS